MFSLVVSVVVVLEPRRSAGRETGKDVSIVFFSLVLDEVLVVDVAAKR